MFKFVHGVIRVFHNVKMNTNQMRLRLQKEMGKFVRNSDNIRKKNKT